MLSFLEGEEFIEEGHACAHPHEYLTGVDKSRHDKDRIGGEVRELDPLELQHHH